MQVRPAKTYRPGPFVQIIPAWRPPAAIQTLLQDTGANRRLTGEPSAETVTLEPGNPVRMVIPAIGMTTKSLKSE